MSPAVVESAGARLPASDHPQTASRAIELSVVSPVYGCSGCLESLVERITSALAGSVSSFEIVLVDDASPDGSWSRITEICETHPQVRALRLARNFGQHAAISAGLENCRGARVVVMDCDLQDMPEEIPRLISKANEGFDVVFARRVSRQDSWKKRLGSRAFFALLRYLTGVPQDHSTANFGVFSRKVIDTVNRMPEVERCFPLMVKWSGFRTATVDVRHSDRAEGNTSYNFGKLIRLALSIVLSYSDKPLRLVVKTGLWFSILAFLIVGLAVYRFLVGDIAVAGYTSIIASIWLVGGVVVSCIGVVGLYVGRLFNDTKGRPYYLVDQYVNFRQESQT